MLTQQQINNRRGKLTASRVAVLMNGDAAGILRLWQELTDDPAFEPEDLSNVWPVRLGGATEAINLEWYERKNNPLTRQGEVVIHPDPDFSWAACTLDGWDEILRCPVETKHVGGREPLEIIIDRYWPQMGWQMFVCGADQCALSVIMGASEPIIEFIPRDDDYIKEMVVRGQQFMRFVELKQPPVVFDPVPAPADASEVYDFTDNNQWAVEAHVWLESRGAAELCKQAEKILKSIVPEDAKLCSGHGIRISRDRAGRLSLREQQ